MVTLSKLNPANNQEVFDFVVEKLYRQGKQSLGSIENGEKEFCVYRAKDGCKCAVGHLIPYDMYTAYMENIAVYTLIKANFEIKKLQKISEYLKKFNVDLLQVLQTAHDFYLKDMYDFFNYLECINTFYYGINLDLVHKLKAEYIQSQKG